MRIAFVGVASYGLFGGPADGWKNLMKQKFNLVKVFRWVDNNLMIKESTDPVSMLEIVRASEELGVKTNTTKDAEFANEQKFIGFLWNINTKTVTLPASKLGKHITELDSFLATELFSRNVVENSTGNSVT